MRGANGPYQWTIHKKSQVVHVNYTKTHDTLCGITVKPRFRASWNANNLFSKLKLRSRRHICKSCMKLLDAKRDAVVRLGELT